MNNELESSVMLLSICILSKFRILHIYYNSDR
nr:MAG TPA: hypothetical protein [Caudoviricetes sp.]